ncbi:hypothetical protein [Bradyrhizobium sp. LB13.1]
MPYLLPKMHERYFYAFEFASIALACLNPRYLPFAVIAQVAGELSYLAFESGIVLGVLPPPTAETLSKPQISADFPMASARLRMPWPMSPTLRM